MVNELKSITMKIVILFLMAVMLCDVSSFYAATDCVNHNDPCAVALWEKFEDAKYKVKFEDNTIYFVTHNKKASSIERRRWATLGYRVTVTSPYADETLYVDVKKNGNYHTIADQHEVKEDGKTYYYQLSEISYKDLSMLLYNQYGDTWVEMSSNCSMLRYKIDAICSYKPSSSDKTKSNVKSENGTERGKIYGTGRLTYDTTEYIYNLGISSELAALQKLFPSTDFSSNYGIERPLQNPLLTISYVAALNESSYANVKCDYDVSDSDPYFIRENGSNYTQSFRRFQYIVGTNDALKIKALGYFGLTKTGYEAATWISAGGKIFSSEENYIASDFTEINSKDVSVILYANWTPNTYKVRYELGQYGNGEPYTENAVYDKTFEVDACYFTSETHTFSHWSYVDENGKTQILEPGQTPMNLTSKNGYTVILTAQWAPKVYEITINKGEGSGGTDLFYQYYGSKFTADADGNTTIIRIKTPTALTGYTFAGIYRSEVGRSEDSKIVDADGNIVVSPNVFSSNTTIFACYDANNYTITFDMQGGELGTETALATYNELYPVANAPVRAGYTFMGYYTEPQDKDPQSKSTQIYTDLMAAEHTYLETNDITLYAHWVDDVAPIVTLSGNSEWTKDAVTVTAEAYDLGVGLKSLTIYRVFEDGSLEYISESTGLNGTLKEEISFTNTTEGVIRYKAVAVDENDVTAESYNVVYYDKTGPTGKVNVTINGTTFTFDIDVTDTKTED
ncbi:MAG: InlB B-repeat-containing protein [Agathobacter sp.]|nr:InlB B-repeat-containing protein [Agathobacter sp.]